MSGRQLRIEVGKSTYTDTETLYLPTAINRFNDREQNYLLYKILAVHLWAQTWFGTFRRPAPDAPYLGEILAGYPDHGRALRLFNLLETFRLNACIKRELPGLAREIHGLHPTPEIHDATWNHIIETLEESNATVFDTLDATSKLYSLQMPWPEAFLYQGEMNLDAAEITIESRAELEKSQLQSAISELLQSLLNGGDANTEELENSEIEATLNEAGTPELTLDGELLTLPPDLEDLLSSMSQDFEDIPDR